MSYKTHSFLSLQNIFFVNKSKIKYWEKGITELAHEQMTNQLSASQALIAAAILLRSAQPVRKALCAVGIRNPQDFELNKFIESPKTPSTLLHKFKVSKAKNRKS